MMAHDRHHRRTISRTDEEWEAMREPFRKCYLDQDMSLKQATQYLSEHHAFPASERQWERKKETWGFTKYQKRETRQQFIDDALRRGMTMEDILNAPDIPAEGSGNDDRAMRRNWRRFVKRDEMKRSRSRSRQPRSPEEGPRRSFEGPNLGQTHQLVEKTYDVGIPSDIVPDRTTGALPNAIMLEATSTDSTGQSPIQLHVVSEASVSTDAISAPDIFISTWDDSMGDFQHHGQYEAATYTNYADVSYQTKNSMVSTSGVDQNIARELNEPFDTFQPYQQEQDPSVLEQQATYAAQESQWGQPQDSAAVPGSNDQAFFEQVRDGPTVEEPYPNIEEVPQVQFDPPFDTSEPPPAMTPRTLSRTSNDYFTSITADPLTTDLSNIVDRYTNDVQRVVQEHMAEIPKITPQVLQKMIQESLQSRRDLCLVTVSKEIENQARIRQQALDSITEKCRNLERIMAEKGIDTRAELRQLKARNKPRQVIENGTMDFSQWNATMNAFPV